MIEAFFGRNAEMINQVLDNTAIEDFEEAIQFYSAKTAARVVVTRNKHDYAAVDKELKVFTPATVSTIALVGIVPNIVRGVWGPAAGYVSDLLRNRKRLLYVQAIAVAIFSYPLFALVKTGELYPVLVGATVLQVIFMISVALGYLYQMELVPTEVRWGLTGIAEVGTSFAAFAPFITTYVGGAFGDPLLSMTMVVSTGALIEVVALFILPKDRTGQPFQ